MSLVPSVSPTNWSFSTQPVLADSSENPVVIGDQFPVAVPKAKLSTKTLQVTIWTADPPESCVGSCQVSLADFDWDAVNVRWYNVLSLQFSIPHGHARSKSVLSSHAGTLKEESSDDSTIISSQASTLTRNINPELSLYTDDIEIPSEAFDILAKPANAVMTDDKTTNTEFNPSLIIKASSNGGGPRPHKSDLVKRSKTFSQTKLSNINVKLNRSDSDGAMPLYRKLPFQHGKIMERRSLRLPTKFNLVPSNASLQGQPPISKDGNSRMKNVEDEKDIFATKLQMKRSRRLARTKEHMMETPLDLELDLAAQKTKLDLLQSDIARLKDIQQKLERAKENNTHMCESWLQDHEYLQGILSKVFKKHFIPKCLYYSIFDCRLTSCNPRVKRSVNLRK